MPLAIATVVFLVVIVYGTVFFYNHPPGRHAWTPDMQVEFIETDE